MQGPPEYFPQFRDRIDNILRDKTILFQQKVAIASGVFRRNLGGGGGLGVRFFQ